MKAKVVNETIRIVSGKGITDYEGSFEQVLPVEDGSMDDYYIWNKAQHLYELIVDTAQIKKDPDQKGKISLF